MFILARNPARSGSLIGELSILVIKDSESEDDPCSMLFVIDRPIDNRIKTKIKKAMKKAMFDDWVFSDVEKAVLACLEENGYAVFDIGYHDIWLQDVAEENPVVDTSLLGGCSYLVVREKGRHDEGGITQSVLSMSSEVDKGKLLQALVKLRRDTDDQWDYTDVETAIIDLYPGSRTVDFQEWVDLGSPEDNEVAWATEESSFCVTPYYERGRRRHP